MLRTICKSKISKATITETELDYEGSITIDRDLMDAADLLPFEKVQVVNMSNGSRLDTYILEGERGSGVICLNGPAARQGMVGDRVLIIAYVICDEDDLEDLEAAVIFVDDKNRLVSRKTYPVK